MIEEELRRWLAAAKKSGRKGWVLVKDGKVVGVFSDRKDAIASAQDPGLYLLVLVE